LTLLCAFDDDMTGRLRIGVLETVGGLEGQETR
jgi:hypothetical protein